MIRPELPILFIAIAVRFVALFTARRAPVAARAWHMREAARVAFRRSSQEKGSVS